MRRDNVESSNIESIGYDADSQTLEIEFKGGAIYQYFDVPQSIWDGLRTSSPGEYLAANIKGSYRYSRI